MARENTLEAFLTLCVLIIPVKSGDNILPTQPSSSKNQFFHTLYLYHGMSPKLPWTQFQDWDPTV